MIFREWHLPNRHNFRILVNDNANNRLIVKRTPLLYFTYKI